MGVYYMNVWRAQDFPFLAQLLFDTSSNSTNFVQYNQSAILGPNLELDPALLEQQGLPYFTATYLVHLLTTSMAITATLTHMVIWNYQDLKSAWAFASWSNLKRLGKVSSRDWRFWKHADSRHPENQERLQGGLDPHFKLMLKYSDCPDWWYGLVLVASIVISLICIYSVNSTLPWWAFLIATALAVLCILFFGLNTESPVPVHRPASRSDDWSVSAPGRTTVRTYRLCHEKHDILLMPYASANMYFTLYGFNRFVFVSASLHCFADPWLAFNKPSYYSRI